MIRGSWCGGWESNGLPALAKMAAPESWVCTVPTWLVSNEENVNSLCGVWSVLPTHMHWA